MTEPSPAPTPLESADAACHAAFEAATAELTREIEAGLLTALRHGLAKHREICATLREDMPASWSDRADALLTYRRLLEAELLTPLAKVFGQRGPGAIIADHVSEAVAKSLESVAALPVSATEPWSSDALTPRPSDGRVRRLGKLVGRGISSARKPGGERELPLRAVAFRHLQQVTVPAEDLGAQAGLVRWAEWSRELDIAWVDWADSVMVPLVRAELPDDETSGDLWKEIGQAATAFEDRLEALIGNAPQAAESGLARARLEASRALLEADLSIAGSFIFNPPEATVAPPALPHVERSAAVLGTWEQGVSSRMRMYAALLSILAGATAVQRRLIWRFREKCLPDVSSLTPIAEALAGLLPDAPGAAKSLGVLEDFRARVVAVLAPAAAAVPDPSVVDSIVSGGSDATVDALSAMLRQAPESITVNGEGVRVRARMKRVETRTVPLQELARQSFDALRIDRIRSSTTGLIDAVDQLREDVAELSNVFTFAYEAAAKELKEAQPEARERATALLTEALNSIAESLKTKVGEADSAVVLVHGRLASEICDGSLALLDRVGAGGMQAQLLAARSHVADVRAWINEHWGPPLDRAVQRGLRRWRVIRRLVTSGFRKGSEIVAGASGEQVASTAAIKVLADSSVVTSRLPLVYQRLFTLDALTDAGLIASRKSELAFARGRWERWQSADGVPLIVRGRQGSGISSFLNVFCAEVAADDWKVAQIPVNERVSTESALAALLTNALGLSACETLTEVAAAVFSAVPETTPALVSLDNMEHLYLRVPGRTDLFERLLTLMAETEPRIFWIGGITTSAWQLVSTAEPTAISQVDVLDLLPLAAEDVKAAIILRHRRSGLPLHYEEPTSGRRLLRRRLRRTNDAEASRRLLEDDYFEQLDRASSGDLRLALFQWLQFSDFDQGGGLMMKPPSRPDVSLLDSLDLTQNFTLKALLEHRTLTLSEHDAIFRLPRQESYQIVESLRNRHLIAPVSGKESAERSEVEGDLRYQIQPLLLGAVISHLRARNIVH